VRTITNVYCFGPFQLDSTRRRLLRGTDPVLLPDRHLEILLQLTANAGRTLSKDELIEAAWKDVAVADNSIEQAISSLRKALGTQPDGAPYIETLARRGYRFSAEVARHLPNARMIVIPRMGHTEDGLSNLDCFNRLLIDFLDRGSAVGLDTSCIETMLPGPVFMDESEMTFLGK